MIYLDHAATTVPHEDVRTAMQSAQPADYYNPSAQYAENAAARLETARQQVAELLGTGTGSIVFTGGGSEADNLALKGLVEGTDQGHVVTSTIEHAAIEGACRWIEERDEFDVTWVSPRSDGRVDPADVRDAMRPDTVLVSIMHANNETGVIQPLEEITAIASERDVYIHSDTVQTAGKLPLDVESMELDLASLSAHKFYGPKGVGALYVGDTAKSDIEPLSHGGGQEHGLRSGTENVPGLIGMGIAAERAQHDLEERAERLSDLRDEFIQLVRERTDGQLVGHPEDRLPGYAMFCFEDHDGSHLVNGLAAEGIAVSSGSACHSGTPSPSRVLTEMGVCFEKALGAVRFSMGRHTTREDILDTVVVLEDVLNSQM